MSNNGNPDAHNRPPEAVVALTNENVVTLIELGQKLERVKIVLIHDPKERYRMMHELDCLYAAVQNISKQASALFVERTAKEFFERPDLFDNMHFQSSLITSRSNLFSDVLRKMGDMLDADSDTYEAKAKLPVRIRMVEVNRRKRSQLKRANKMDDYAMAGDEMRKYSTLVQEELHQKLIENDPLAHMQMGKITYEWALDARDNLEDYDHAIRLGEMSTEHCKVGGDLFGEMTARGNAVLDTKTRKAKQLGSAAPEFAALLAEARTGFIKDLDTCLAELNNYPPESFEHDRFLRVWANNGIQLVDAVVQQEDLPYADAVKENLNKNPFYVAQEKAGSYKSILDGLENLRSRLNP